MNKLLLSNYNKSEFGFTYWNVWNKLNQENWVWRNLTNSSSKQKPSHWPQGSLNKSTLMPMRFLAQVFLDYKTINTVTGEEVGVGISMINMMTSKYIYIYTLYIYPYEFTLSAMFCKVSLTSLSSGVALRNILIQLLSPHGSVAMRMQGAKLIIRQNVEMGRRGLGWGGWEDKRQCWQWNVRTPPPPPPLLRRWSFVVTMQHNSSVAPHPLLSGIHLMNKLSYSKSHKEAWEWVRQNTSCVACKYCMSVCVWVWVCVYPLSQT